MRLIKTFAGAAAGILLLQTVAMAEDRSSSAQPPQTPPNIADDSASQLAWRNVYLRGDLGFGWLNAGNLSQAELEKNLTIPGVTGGFVSQDLGETFVGVPGRGVGGGARRRCA